MEGTWPWQKDSDGDIDAEDIKKLSEEDAKWIKKKIFWDYFQGRLHPEWISSSSSLSIGVHNSGRKQSLKIVQRVVNADVDGIVGVQTLTAINYCRPGAFVQLLKIERQVILNNIIKKGKTKSYSMMDGWIEWIHSALNSA